MIMAVVLTLRLGRQSHAVPAGQQQAHRYTFVPCSQNACLSRPPLLHMSDYYLWHPTHLLPTRAESAAQPRHCTHNARLLLPSNYAILRSHPLLTSLSLLKYLHHLGALSTPIIHLLLRRLPRTSFHCLTANFYLSSIVPRRFRTLSILVQRTD